MDQESFFEQKYSYRWESFFDFSTFFIWQKKDDSYQTYFLLFLFLSYNKNQKNKKYF